MTLSARWNLKAATTMTTSIITTIIITERSADNSSLGQATPGWGRPCDGGVKRPRFGVRGLGWNACSGAYSTFPAHAHVNWANSSMCICYKEEEKVNHWNVYLPRCSIRRQTPWEQECGRGDASLWLSWCLSSSVLPMYVHLSRPGTEKLFLFFHKIRPQNESQLLQLALHWRNWSLPTLDSKLGGHSSWGWERFVLFFRVIFMRLLSCWVYELPVSCWAARTQVKHLKALIRRRGGESGRPVGPVLIKTWTLSTCFANHIHKHGDSYLLPCPFQHPSPREWEVEVGVGG